MKIVHIAFMHSEKDIRILLKECISLKNAGHQVYYITANKSGNLLEYQYDSVNILTIRVNEKNKLKRYLNYFKYSYKMALNIDADVYHIHEPNLLLLGLKLKKKGKKIIFDAHENYHKYKYGMNRTSGIFTKIKYTFLSSLYWRIIKHTVKKCESIITAGQEIAEIYKKMGVQTVILNNYPLLNDLPCNLSDFLNNDNIFCYVGGVNEKRKIDSLVTIFDELEDVQFIYAGPISSEMEDIVGKDNKNSSYIGILNREGMKDLYAKSIAGIILLSPDPNHYDIQSNKLFEYMMSGLPVICSDFPKWKEFIDKNKCGIAVNPEDREEIKDAINFIISNREQALSMAINGRNLVEEKYNWNREEIKLIDLYSKIEISDNL